MVDWLSDITPQILKYSFTGPDTHCTLLAVNDLALAAAEVKHIFSNNYVGFFFLFSFLFPFNVVLIDGSISGLLLEADISSCKQKAHGNCNALRSRKSVVAQIVMASMNIILAVVDESAISREPTLPIA